MDLVEHSNLYLFYKMMPSSYATGLVAVAARNELTYRSQHGDAMAEYYLALDSFHELRLAHRRAHIKVIW
ncbi:hypothetical protein [Secundilactobacillus paracollinoides]|uniref:Uncharacterized protein n=1 Tax=Secundilactobacillus paracollinoides TaxID=240427 RepID=A0A1B2J1Q7_9LACO|nr:hypothetical protein [Secundilactobacillus paracollinoides]ANZ62282.1 hypothetical protein AYR61_13725 [Secundilactobacillus paracollinoides]ANZ68231.1 hypothetical protein AYR63_14600 [Secundilactobacillus paracollinoides]